MRQSVRQTIIGVDFSGAMLAGEKIWIATANPKAGVLTIESLQRASELPNGAVERDVALAALVEYLKQFPNAACGLDFPFSLARENFGTEYSSWRDWLFSLENFSDAETFRQSFSGARRRTDIAGKAPFSPLNHRLFRQTFFGIRHVLFPLAQGGARGLPFDAPDENALRENALWLLEICPASLLKREKLYLSYKGKSDLQRENRARILEAFVSKAPLEINQAMSTRVVEDTEGDALDAVLAAVSIFRALQAPERLAARDETEQFEGRIYF